MCISELTIKEIHKLSDRFKLNVQSGATTVETEPSPSNTVVFSNPAVAVVFIFSLAPAKQISFNSDSCDLGIVSLTAGES